MASLDTIGGLHYEMMKRCYNENSVAFKDYGAKGITVCDEWHDREVFRKWCKENGWNKELRLQRIDCSKGYYPSNCYFGVTNKKKSDKNRLNRERAKENKEFKRKYGIERFTDERINTIFHSMHERCERKSHPNFSYYGGRGISVCEQWSGKRGIYNFVMWAYENGYKDNLTIDRINNDLGYSPENCRWATYYEQGSNKRNNKLFDYLGGRYTLSLIARNENVSRNKLEYRLVLKGMTVKEALDDIRKKSC